MSTIKISELNDTDYISLEDDTEIRTVAYLKEEIRQGRYPEASTLSDEFIQRCLDHVRDNPKSEVYTAPDPNAKTIDYSEYQAEVETVEQICERSGDKLENANHHSEASIADGVYRVLKDHISDQGKLKAIFQQFEEYRTFNPW